MGMEINIMNIPSISNYIPMIFLVYPIIFPDVMEIYREYHGIDGNVIWTNCII